MVFHVRRVSQCSEGNFGLRGGSVELCSRKGLLSVYPKPHKCSTSVRKGKTYEYISMDNILLIRDLLREKSKNKIMIAQSQNG